MVDRGKTVLENFLTFHQDISPAQTRNYLAQFLFAETAVVNKKASFLSGGEVARLALAMVTSAPIDLLILDEPTNNLDIESIEQLEQALAGFKGAIVIISHDLS